MEMCKSQPWADPNSPDSSEKLKIQDDSPDRPHLLRLPKSGGNGKPRYGRADLGARHTEGLKEDKQIDSLLVLELIGVWIVICSISLSKPVYAVDRIKFQNEKAQGMQVCSLFHPQPSLLVILPWQPQDKVS